MAITVAVTSGSTETINTDSPNLLDSTNHWSIGSDNAVVKLASSFVGIVENEYPIIQW
jgi:hypothetical protein